jgi:outer membrane protein OmpA-like peptidoglycan-associated protein
MLSVFANIGTAFGQGHFELYTVYFHRNQFNIDNQYGPFLKGLAKKLGSDSCRLIKIYGYADPSGSTKYNDDLSEKRVNAVYNNLLSCSRIDTSIIYTQWQDDSDEFYDLHLPGAHIRERAVDISVLFNNKRSATVSGKAGN